jgi:DNA-binding GntR family transcriptional regulator
MIEGLWNTTHRYRRVLFTTFAPHDFEIANYEHALICDAIVSGHVSRAERQLIAHLERSRIRLSENPGLFF